MNKQPYKYRSILICVFLVAAIVAVYWPVYSYDFIRYDDGAYVVKNVNIQQGLNFKTIYWAFTAISHSGHYWHPITWLSHTLDYQLFKNWAGGHHIMNVFFHILNTLILFYVLMRMTGAVWPSAFVAAVFALHPLHVESVAWISERKDVLSAFFWLLTMWAYVHYAKTLKLKWYLAAIALFLLALMSKPMVVTLPFVLLLLDYWPLERKFSRRLLVEKIPFFAGSFACCIVTFIAQQKSAVISLEDIGFKSRIANAIVSYAAYIIKMIWPSRLSLVYPHSGSELSTTKIIICALLLLLSSVYFIYIARRRRYFTVGWLWYLGTLVPVIGLVQVGVQSMADRYTYMTLTGLFIIIAFGAKEFVPKRRHKMLALLAAVLLIALAITARGQLEYWKNSMSLFEHSLQVTENNYLMIDNYASLLIEQGRFNEAIGWCEESLKICPYSAVGHNNLGCALLQSGKVQQAIDCFRTAIKYNPDFLQANLNLADSLAKQGDLEEAVSYYKQAIKIAPDNAQAFLGLAITLTKLQKFDQAIEPFDKAIKLEPANISAHGYRGMALAAIGKIDEAIEDIRFVLKARPDDVQMLRNLGIFLERKGDIAGAIESYRAALRIDPDNENLRQLLEDDLKKQESATGK
jgi:tetratricopeptide (TPR) repeat protein